MIEHFTKCVFRQGYRNRNPLPDDFGLEALCHQYSLANMIVSTRCVVFGLAGSGESIVIDWS